MVGGKGGLCLRYRGVEGGGAVKGRACAQTVVAHALVRLLARSLAKTKKMLQWMTLSCGQAVGRRRGPAGVGED